jgi:bifunctional non-homologous end joining protein LigD
LYRGNVSDPKDGLDRYRSKRIAGATPEPMASAITAAKGPRMFVVHQHDATRMHWDLRLEIDGVLCSWAVPKPPCLDPDIKRLAVRVENHPLEYAHFEAVIPDGNYGAGPMIAWDRGVFRPLLVSDDEIKFELYGYKLRGAFTLVKTKQDWLLIKKRDEHATTVPLSPASILSGLTVEELGERAPRHRELLAEIADTPEQTFTLAALEPMLCETAPKAFTSPDWVFELKYDGFRLLADRAHLRYRSGLDSTERYPELTSALRALPIDVVLDGEIVIFDAEGKPDFHALGSRAQLHRTSEIQRAALSQPVTYVVFDLLAAGGHDLRGLPLLERKALLQRLVPPVGPLRYGDHIPEKGEALLAQTVARGLEGVVGKKANSPYRGKRSGDWLKIKQDPEGDFVVCGFTRPKGSREGLGALHLCVMRDDAWVYAGKVGTGFDDALLRSLEAELSAAPAWTPPWKGEGRWVKPELVVQVRYREWRDGSSLRHPVFVRMQRDKEPPAAEIETDVSTRELRLTRLHKVFWPEDNITKGDLVEYYRSIAPYALPYLKDRPTVLTRYPDGITGDMFYQKNLPDWTPPWLRTVPLWSEHSQREIHYLLLDDADGLAFIANMASIPIHCWASRTADLERPDWTIVDLDPKNAPREHVVPLALSIHALCETIGLPNYVKTSGQTGLHVLIPLAGQCTFEQARQLAYLLGMIIERQHPDMATTARNPAARGGRVYLDWGQNAHGQLLVAPFSVRPVPAAPVSMPLEWDEVVVGLDPKQFNLRNALARVQAWKRDPIAPVLTTRPDLRAVFGKLESLLQQA